MEALVCYGSLGLASHSCHFKDACRPSRRTGLSACRASSSSKPETPLEALSEAAKSEGRIAQTTNIVLGGAVSGASDEEWKELNEKDADVEEQSSNATESCCNSNSTESTNAVNYSEAPSKSTNRLIALASAATAVGLFLATRGGLTGATLGELASAALPYEEALANGRPTVLEFYADWCEVCKQMAPDVYKVEQKYKDVVNFVVLNVDNTKWEQELDEFGVEGIPHFTFLDKEGNEEGNIVGKLPKKYLEDNVVALSKGEKKLPHSRVVGQFSNPELHKVPRMAGPRSHG